MGTQKAWTAAIVASVIAFVGVVSAKLGFDVTVDEAGLTNVVGEIVAWAVSAGGSFLSVWWVANK